MNNKISEKRLTAEKTVVGSMLLNSGCILDVLSALTEAHFHNEEARAIFRAIRGIAGEHGMVDVVTVLQYLDDHPQCGSCSVQFMRQLMDELPTPIYVLQHVQTLLTLQADGQ